MAIIVIKYNGKNGAKKNQQNKIITMKQNKKYVNNVNDRIRTE